MKIGYVAFAAGIIASLLSLSSHAQPLNDPAIHGMRTLPVVEGCNVPGGLRPITSSDGPNDAMFWCGEPPFCLTMPVGNQQRCHIVPGSRNGGRTGVRDPQDLICDISGVNPTGGRCPVPPTLSATVNNVQHANLNQGSGVTLRVNTASTVPLSTPTALTMACSGANAGRSPFNQTNLIGIAGRNHTFSVAAAVNAGVTNCIFTATNPAGTATYETSFTAAPSVGTPAPTIEVFFNPTNPAVNSNVQLRTRTTHATNLSWSCTGRWTNLNTARAVGGWIASNHRVSGSPGTANCTFTAAGPGGSRSANASWTSVASGGGDDDYNNLPDGLQVSFTATVGCLDGSGASVQYVQGRVVHLDGNVTLYTYNQNSGTRSFARGSASWPFYGTGVNVRAARSGNSIAISGGSAGHLRFHTPSRCSTGT